MATPYQDIFKKFLGSIDDDLYVELTDDEIDEDLIVIMDIGLMLFKTTEVNLNDRDDVAKQFNVDVPIRLQKLIAVAMKYEWCGRQIYKIDLVKQKMLQADFEMTSQASHLSSLIKMQRRAEREFYNKTRNKSYSTPEGKANWSGLAGGN